MVKLIQTKKAPSLYQPQARYLPLVSHALAVALGFIIGHFLLSRYLNHLAQGGWIDWGMEIWQTIASVALAALLLLISTRAQEYLQKGLGIAKEHAIRTARIPADFKVPTPGQWLDYVIWAYITAACTVCLPASTYFAVVIGVPLWIAPNLLVGILLFIFGFLVGPFVQQSTLKAVDTLFMAVPEEMGLDLKLLGPLMDLVFA